MSKADRIHRVMDSIHIRIIFQLKVFSFFFLSLNSQQQLNCSSLIISPLSTVELCANSCKIYKLLLYWTCFAFKNGSWKKKCTAKTRRTRLTATFLHSFEQFIVLQIPFFHRPTKTRMFLKFELSRLSKACKTKEPIFFLYRAYKNGMGKKSICHFQAICLRVFSHSQYSYAPWHLKLMFMFCGFNFFLNTHRTAWHISFFNMCYDIFFLTFLMM